MVVPLFTGSDATGDAVAADVLVGKTFSNATANGITGTRELVPVHKSGEEKCTYDYDPPNNSWQWDTNCTNASRPPGQDGELQLGVAYPSPRFTDNGNGTVTDNMTGLVWLKDASCFGQRTWLDALTDTAQLNSGECGLTDNSSAGDWHLPSVIELQGICHYGYYGPAISNAAGTARWIEGDAFLGVQTYYYWSSTNNAGNPNYAWSVFIGLGVVYANAKSAEVYHVWPVRGRE